MAHGSGTSILSLVKALSIIALLLLLTTSKAQEPLYNFCSDANDTYATNSTYRANLNVLLGSLSSTINTTTANGFSTNITGDVPDRVYGLALCRGDAKPADCGSCLQVAASDIPQICPFRTSGVVWYDNCLLRYSNRRFLNGEDNSQRVYLRNTANITQGASEFNVSVWSALQGLAQYASRNGSARPPMFAAGQMDLGRDVQYPKLYALVQCTRDISADNCNTCLTNIISELPRCCQWARGGRVLGTSCNFRYEVYTFFNYSAALDLPSLSAAPSPSPAPSPSGQPSTPGSGANNTNNTTPSDGSGKKNNATIIAVTIPLAVAFSLLILTGCICFQKHKATKKKTDAEKRQEVSTESLVFDLPAIRQATNNFSPINKLGEGGFGAVYKGLLSSGQEIAVKRLSTGSGQGVKELKNEVILLAKLQHRNLVRLLGLCLEDEEKLLIYEYVANKSLDTFLFDPIKKGELNWERRYNIIAGIARGLLYLHEESQIKIIHRDLKAGNILLDADLNPKISDFGLARLFGGDQTQECTSRVVGTFGYMSPEYAMRGHFSNKSDVFSFGVLVLEIITGQKSNSFPQSGNGPDLLSYVWDHWSSGSAADILDPSLEGNFQLGEAMRCIEIGLLCVQESPHDRPTMSKVVLMLSSHSVSIQVPTRPLFLAGYSKEMTFRQETGSDLSADLPNKSGTSSNMYSPNEMSVTELEPR